MLLLGYKIVVDILKRAFGLTPPVPRKLIYVHSFARRLPRADKH
jgi:hypothetical protein